MKILKVLSVSAGPSNKRLKILKEELAYRGIDAKRVKPESQ